MPKKSHFTIFTKQNFLQNTKKNTCELNLYCWDHVCEVNEWCLIDCFHRKFTAPNQIMVHDYCIAKCKKLSAYGGYLMAPRDIFSQFKIFTLIRTL